MQHCRLDERVPLFLHWETLEVDPHRVSWMDLTPLFISAKKQTTSVAFH